MTTGKVFQLPNGQSIWIDTLTMSQIPKIGKLITKDEFEKKKDQIDGRFLVHVSVDDNISHRKVDIYYYKVCH